MASKLIIIIAASVATVISMFVVGKMLDRCGTEAESNRNGGAR